MFNIFDSFKKNNPSEDEYEAAYGDEVYQMDKVTQELSRTMVYSARDVRIIVAKPKTFSDADYLCDYLLAGQTLALDFGGVDENTVRRILDYFAGVVRAIEGSVSKVSSTAYVVGPKGLHVSPESIYDSVAEE